ncbi:MAG TPA: DUF899 domain-containing protein [Thermomicrobiales bacterium]|nr:DUF899 domain-containing protein [Thermomicrobiales bacterium]
MTTGEIVHPPIATHDEWLAARQELLVREKEVTRARDALSAVRRRLPMVKIEKDYRFMGPDGEVGLADLFEGRRQLIVYHFMFDPRWDAGCPGCTGYVDDLGGLGGLRERDATFALVSRAPFAKLAAYQAQRGWRVPWYSSHGSAFNYDFHVTFDESVAPLEYNFRGATFPADEQPAEGHGLSVFFRLGDDVFHTYSAYARGVEGLTTASGLLDVTPYGRQEDWEDSPPGWPQRPTYD